MTSIGLDLLIVDDAALIRERLAAMLTHVRGVKCVREAANVDEGIEQVRAAVPDLVLLDISMPGGSGIDVLAELHQMDVPPVVAVLTNYPFEEYRERCEALGAEYFFDKTAEFHKVVEVVKQMVEHAAPPP